MQALGKLMTRCGLIGVLISIAWWHAFFPRVHKFLGIDAAPPLDCLYSGGGPCGLIYGAASLVDSMPYNPHCFVISSVILIIGGLIILEESQASRVK